jgi:chromosome transmission fidelity protein 4
MNRTIFTGGSDCLVRIHKANDPDAEPGFHDNHEDAVTSISCTVCPQMSRKYPGLD